MTSHQESKGGRGRVAGQRARRGLRRRHAKLIAYRATAWWLGQMSVEDVARATRLAGPALRDVVRELEVLARALNGRADRMAERAQTAKNAPPDPKV